MAYARGESLGTTISTLIASALGNDETPASARPTSVDPQSGLLAVSGGPTRTAADVHAMAYDE